MPISGDFPGVPSTYRPDNVVIGMGRVLELQLICVLADQRARACCFSVPPGQERVCASSRTKARISRLQGRWSFEFGNTPLFVASICENLKMRLDPFASVHQIGHTINV
jgi:hypothetical protein